MSKEAYGYGDEFSEWSRFEELTPDSEGKVPIKEVIEVLEDLEERAKKADVKAYVGSARYHSMPEDDETPPKIWEYKGKRYGTGASPRALIEALKSVKASSIHDEDPLYPSFRSIQTKEPSSVKRFFGVRRPKLSKKKLKAVYGLTDEEAEWIFNQ